MIRRIWSYRQLVTSLIRRQFQLRYRQSFVGILWALVPPMAILGVGVVVFNKVVGVDTGGVSYPVFALAALAPWTFLANSVILGVPSVAESPHIVVRLAFPRAVLPLSMIGVSLLDLAVSIALFAVFAYGVGDGLPLTALWFPPLLLVEVVFVVGIVLLGSALNVFARDVRLAVPLLAQLWLFLTPVMYPLSSVPTGLHGWYLLNPMTGLVESFRRILVYGLPPDIGLMTPAIVGAITAFVVGSWYFRTTEPRFADVI